MEETKQNAQVSFQQVAGPAALDPGHVPELSRVEVNFTMQMLIAPPLGQCPFTVKNSTKLVQEEEVGIYAPKLRLVASEFINPSFFSLNQPSM